MFGLKTWYKAGLVIWLVVAGLGLALAVFAAGWRIALYGFFFHINADTWYEGLFDIIGKMVNYFPILALPFAVHKRSDLA
jgi:predicted exporter